jgi:hypothetical protein
MMREMTYAANRKEQNKYAWKKPGLTYQLQLSTPLADRQKLRKSRVQGLEHVQMLKVP